jgi:hypothetical protein
MEAVDHLLGRLVDAYGAGLQELGCAVASA